jgi:hypothetical protein
LPTCSSSRGSSRIGPESSCSPRCREASGSSSRAGIGRI